ncbi:TetR family transcriptional regulator C-terminal domain-containing protein [Streptomonospora sp. S1-112]|uniref:TetR family transcriptional regulator C-terminal domain-containing protein n=1 Tax=Streptomonospora mangrovi TaxID=2883123 RepID=A0A9X3NSZ4_9ACTN|nr:TetR family transcriptional regulator C-terminal domain-containing protein [Streptomonospora mangrovi]MDA0563601.1 TetR family transcriptional regulator C-terminal domain-containing protein [Streptomonospora mangrovi]
MPRTADHDARRRQIAEGVRTIVSEAGLDAATVARVARASGMSVGLVQHYFPSKDALLLFAYRHVMDRIGTRVAQRVAEGEAARGTIAASLRAALREMLPLDHERRSEYRVAQAFAGRSLDSAELAEVGAQTSRRLRDQIAVAVGNGKECGEVEPEVDTGLAAARVLAVTEGLAVQLHREPHGRAGTHPLAEAADAVLLPTLESVFTGTCRQYSR